MVILLNNLPENALKPSILMADISNPEVKSEEIEATSVPLTSAQFLDWMDNACDNIVHYLKRRSVGFKQIPKSDLARISEADILTSIKSGRELLSWRREIRAARKEWYAEAANMAELMDRARAAGFTFTSPTVSAQVRETPTVPNQEESHDTDTIIRK